MAVSPVSISRAASSQPMSAEERKARVDLAGLYRLVARAGLDDLLLIASTETNTDDDRAALVAALSSQLAH